jgi:hypothetical protein
VTPAANLAFAGAPNCFLNAQSSVIQTILPLVGTSSPWSIAIPNTPSLSNARIFTQGALLVPPGTNALNVLTANGVELLIGTL